MRRLCVGGPNRIARELEAREIPCFHEEKLARYTTIRIGGPAELLVRPRTVEELSAVLDLARAEDVPVRVLGAGSNVLVSDAGVRGIVLHTRALDEIRFEEGGLVQAGAGVHFPTLVRKATAKGLRGLEAGVGIPGSLGGVLTMNAGAYQFSIGPLVHEVVAVSLSRGPLTLAGDAIDFRYRASSFGRDLIVAHVRLVLAEDEPRAVRADMDKHMRFRKETQPVGVKSSGCIFKNPEGASAGKLLDELGLKGFRLGEARISEVHANFIVHDGAARASEILDLIDIVRTRVRKELSVELETEIMTWN
ncbi:MAG: UDP-N-acetylmuramate dehydrogenase [Acidobacteria bacterium]|nr:MAG: UDP-N-acetylmuramate dehydrogenase [Acidobacteriota bacterium]